MIRPPSHIPPHDFDRLSGAEYVEVLDLQEAFSTDPNTARLERLNVLLGKATDPAWIKSVKRHNRHVRRDRVGGSDSSEQTDLQDRSGPHLSLRRDIFPKGSRQNGA